MKVLHDELAASLGTDRFLREIRITAKLSHPHILPLYDSGAADDLLFFVMPYVQGESLRDRVERERQLPVDEALRIACEVADGLAHAHSHDIVHRDIKPENVLLSGGHAVVADFGIARAIRAAGGTRLTTSGMAVGTPAYMSPEQAAGDEQLDGRSDVYSLACVLYEMLAGQPPFTGRTVESLIHQHLAAPPPPIAGIRSGVSEPVAEALRQSLAKAPADRFPTATAFAEALEQARTGAPGVRFFSALVARRVPQILLIYAALAAGVVWLLDFAVNRFVLSPHLPAFGLVALASLVPTVILLAYFHGKPGAPRWTRAETIGIPTNLFASVAVLLSMFGTKDLGAATTTVTLQDEEGRTLERVVPKSAFRKRIAIFPFDNPSADATLDWLAMGFPLALEFDLGQDLFIEVQSAPNFAEQLQRKGYPDGTGLPLTLRREIAEEAHAPYFVSGSIGRVQGELRVTVALYETERARLLEERVYTGADAFTVADRASVQLRHDLGIPDHHVDGTPDLPVAELLTHSSAAFAASAEGFHAALVRHDWPAALRALEQAVAEDSTYAVAQMILYVVHLSMNDGAKAGHALQQAMRHLHRLPERWQFNVKYSYYDFHRQPEKALAVTRMRVDLFPDDIEGRQVLAMAYEQRNRRDSAIAQFEEIVALDPSHAESLKRLGLLHELNGDLERARVFREGYAEQFPTDHEGYLALGGLYERLGEHDAARSQYQRALSVEPDDVGTLIRLARLDADIGRFDPAAEQFAEALAVARTPADSARALGAAAGYFERRGQVRRSLEATSRRWAMLERFAPPVNVLLAKLESLDRLVMTGQDSLAFATLRGVQTQLMPPFEDLVFLGYLLVYLELEQPDSAEAAMAGIERFISAFGVETLRPLLLHSQGRIHELRGSRDRVRATESLRTALAAWAEADPDFRPAGKAREKLQELGGTP